MRDKNIYNSLKCVWMTSSVISYKLCDREFDCDNCPLDRSIRNLPLQPVELKEAKVPDNIISRIIKRICEKESKGSYVYLKNNLVIKNLNSDIFYLGFSPAAIHLLDNPVELSYSASEDNVNKNDNFLSLKGEWGEIDISSPINFSWMEKIITSKDQITAERWFGLIRANKSEMDADSIPLSEYHSAIMDIASELEKIENSFPDIGTTMYDGGNEIHSLYLAIGKQKYLEILNKLFEIR